MTGERAPEVMEPEGSPKGPGLMMRTMATIVVALGWLLFATFWVFFLASGLGYAEYQGYAVCLASVLVMATLMAAMWIPWGLRHQSDRDRWMWTRPGFSSRVWVTGGIGSGLLVFLVLWLWTFADRYTHWQNLAVAFMLLVVGGAAASLIWVPWGMRHPRGEWDARRRAIEDEISERVKTEVHAALDRELGKGK